MTELTNKEIKEIKSNITYDEMIDYLERQSNASFYVLKTNSSSNRQLRSIEDTVIFYILNNKPFGYYASVTPGKCGNGYANYLLSKYTHKYYSNSYIMDRIILISLNELREYIINDILPLLDNSRHLNLFKNVLSKYEYETILKKIIGVVKNE